ncbi:DNA cytosine methyltransferase [Pseudomonas coleopterorum]|uniref:DNA cytosine methyltransferase n=1 Tax=Pseudomonas coleopterorum TaxID=1605838 RepID=UPI002A6B3256|nr:DNA cytosine methyltransferase [Pseudomonas coleopterorum]MDY1046622.1 DNA cytosine methyltransferase [Pseudomonas coleopterorum]
MSAYYNEIDPYAAQWLRNLIKAGHIADGIVDERSIEDVCPSDLAGFTQCHFFAGVGVWSLALRRAGWPDELPVWTGSCPCQPFSKAGKGSGFADERHLWPDFYWLIEQCCPSVLFGEQVPVAAKHGWLDLVSTDLETLDYAFGALRFGASDVGAPIERQRIYFVAKHIRKGVERQQQGTGSSAAGPWGWRGEEDLRAIYSAPLQPGSRWPQPIVRRVDDGLASCMGRLRAYGNAINAEAAREFIAAYLESI